MSNFRQNSEKSPQFYFILHNYFTITRLYRALLLVFYLHFQLSIRIGKKRNLYSVLYCNFLQICRMQPHTLFVATSRNRVIFANK